MGYFEQTNGEQATERVEIESGRMVSVGLWEEFAATEPDTPRQATAKEIYSLIKQQNHRCALTGIELTPDTAHVDHKKARSEGGGDEISNLQIVHKIVNRMKNTMSIDELVAWSKLIVAHASMAPSGAF